MIYAETARLTLRDLEREDLPRLVQCLDVWDIARWLTVLPYPYTLRDAETFFADMEAARKAGTPQGFALSLRDAPELIGMVGLHAPRGSHALPQEIEIGYWLTQAHWGKGLISEAVRAVLALAFARPEVACVGATTALNNFASQNVLSKAGLRNMGKIARDYTVLRGDDTIYKWLIARADYEAARQETGNPA